jgi:DNA-binding IclR family transcriptional regulator
LTPPARNSNSTKTTKADKPAGQVRRRNPLLKAMTMLHWMVDTGRSSWGVREVARAVEMPPSTVFRTLSLLEEAGIVQGDPEDGRYQFTLDFYRLAARAALDVPIREAALPLMRELADRIGEAAYLGVYDPNRRQMMYIDGLDTMHPVQYVLTRFQWTDLYAGAGGMGILPFLPEEERERIVRETKLLRITDKTVGSKAELRREIDEIRAQGYCVSASQRIPGAAGVSAPVFGSDGKILGVIVLAFPESRLPNYDPHDLGRQVAAAARQTSERLGWREGSEDVDGSEPAEDGS